MRILVVEDESLLCDQIQQYFSKKGFAVDVAKVFIAAMRAGYHCVIVCVPGKLYPYGVVEDVDGKDVDFIEIVNTNLSEEVNETETGKGSIKV